MIQSDQFGIYIHIPFCRQKCQYCDFLSAPATEPAQEAYLRALAEEITVRAPLHAHRRVTSIYIGGGTPTVVDPKRLCGILELLFSRYRIEREAEISMEMNPATVTKQALADYRKAGVNRVSIGLQSARDEELKRLGRIHDLGDFLRTYEAVRDAGFTNVNVDIMAALPGQTVEDYGETLRLVSALSPIPEHISAYSLIIEEGTPFFERYGALKEAMEKTGEPQPGLPSEEEERQMDEMTERLLKEAGYHRYEISNYSLEGRECRHNIGYWKRKDYAGFGLGAASLLDNVRSRNHTQMRAYLEEKDKEMERAALSEKERMEEFMFLGLRLTEGVDREEFKRAFGVPMEEVYGDVLRKNAEAGLLLTGEKAALTRRGRDVGNYVMAQFLL